MQHAGDMAIELQNYWFAAYWLRSIEPDTPDPALAALRAECVDELYAISLWSEWPRLRGMADRAIAEQEELGAVAQGGRS